MINDLHFLILTCLHKIHRFSSALSCEAISIDKLGSIAPIASYLYHSLLTY